MCDYAGGRENDVTVLVGVHLVRGGGLAGEVLLHNSLHRCGG